MPLRPRKRHGCLLLNISAKKSMMNITHTPNIAHEYASENCASSEEYIISADKDASNNELAISVKIFIIRRSINRFLQHQSNSIPRTLLLYIYFIVNHLYISLFCYIFASS